MPQGHKCEGANRHGLYHRASPLQDGHRAGMSVFNVAVSGPGPLTIDHMSRNYLLWCTALVAFASGCATSPPAEGTAVSAYAVGDRARVTFDEVVVSLPFRGASGPYQNLHVAPAAIVNARRTTYTSSYQAEGILRRLETRVAARLSEVLSGLGEQSLSDTPSLRKRVLTEAQGVVDEALRQWEHGSEYRVEMVIANLYWTDASVGRGQQPQRGWWW